MIMSSVSCSTPYAIWGSHDKKKASAIDYDSCLLYGSLDEKENSLKDTSNADFQIAFAEDIVFIPSISCRILSGNLWVYYTAY